MQYLYSTFFHKILDVAVQWRVSQIYLHRLFPAEEQDGDTGRHASKQCVESSPFPLWPELWVSLERELWCIGCVGEDGMEDGW